MDRAYIRIFTVDFFTLYLLHLLKYVELMDIVLNILKE